jgi:hypothetical protein
MSSGFGDPIIGMKQLSPAAAPFKASLVLSLSLPEGARDIPSHGYDPTVQLSWSKMANSKRHAPLRAFYDHFSRPSFSDLLC